MGGADRTWREGPVTVRVPATSANLGPGFDALGLALAHYDEVTAELSPGPSTVSVSGEGADSLPGDDRHLVLRTMHTVFDTLGVPRPGIALRCVNRIPHGRGLGSSAAAIVAGVLAAGALLRDGPLVGPGLAVARERVFALAADIEGHPDNVAPCVYGGCTIAWRGDSTSERSGPSPIGATDFVRGGSEETKPRWEAQRGGGGWAAARFEPFAGLSPVLCVPEERLATERARGLLPERVPHADAAFTAGRAALLVAALSGRPELLLAATEDRLHQDYRASAMPATAALVAELRKRGLPAVVSGAGPSVLVLASGEDHSAVRDSTAGEPGTAWHISPFAVDHTGALVTSPDV
ncbi:homoserine kinase [Allonocardiopsis opalescens]|uniref:Homoserine kinase n=1 Tax=Allonocardiopsis opalescens TaxID=1144618 RepID=A0A2T0QCU7_9ACTN|nr:homoserine kinase [Allonocardiopsis opalescens]PRY01776.1 homoserine kinase [Allonocardiopsis opalescens]